MTNNSNEDFSGGEKICNKKNLGSDVFRLEKRLYEKGNPIAKAYDEIVKSEAPKPINHLFYDLSDTDHFDLLVLTDNHWGSISSHFMATVAAQMMAKYVPSIYIGYNGDNRNNALNTEQCVSSPLDNALSPVIELKLWYDVLADPVIREKVLFINSGNHDNGERTKDIGTDILATAFAGTPYFERYSRFATLLTVRLKADNKVGKVGYEDVKIYIDHGNGLVGGDGNKLDAGMKLARQYGARIAIFGHVHQDMSADYRVENLVDPNGSKTVKNDLTCIVLPATLGQETYALDKRYETAPSDLKLIRIGTKENDYLLGSTQRERRTLPKTSIYCDCTPIPNKLWKSAMSEANRLREKFENIQSNTNLINKKLKDIIETYYQN